MKKPKRKPQPKVKPRKRQPRPAPKPKARKRPTPRKGAGRAKRKPEISRKEKARRSRISLALKRFHEKRKTIKVFLEGDSKADKAWGKKVVEEAKRAKKAAQQKPPKIRKRDRKLAEMPEGFTDLGKAKIGEIQTMLERAQSALGTPESLEALSIKQPLATDLRTHVNSDGSFDAELRVREIPKRLRIHSLAIFMEGLIDPVAGTFMSTGFRSEHTEEFKGKKYERFGGKIQVGTNYFRSRKKAIAFATGRMVHERFTDKRYHKPSEFYVRFHWSPYGKHPKRKPR